MRKPIQLNQTNKIDECETIIYSDGSVIINTAQKEFLCLDFSEILILFQKASRLNEHVT